MLFKIISVIFIIVIGLVYFYFRLTTNIILASYVGFKQKNANPIEKKFQSIFFLPFIMASLSIAIISIMKLFAWISFSLWWALLPIFIDFIMSIIAAQLIRRIWGK